MNYKVSVIVSGVRPQNWENIYRDLSTDLGGGNFQLICCGPYFPPESLQIYYNFIFSRHIIFC